MAAKALACLVAPLCAATAFAANQIIEFKGDIKSHCSFDGLRHGVLGANLNNTELSSLHTDGASARLSVRANGPTEMVLEQVRLTAAPAEYAQDGAALKLRIVDQNGRALLPWEPRSRTMALDAPGADLVIDARVGDGGPLPAGVYEMQAVLTCAPIAAPSA